MARRRTNFELSARDNMESYYYYIDRLTELSISMFEWVNLPDTVDERFLEMTLFTNGCAVYFNDDVLGNLALPVAINGQWNVYKIPIRRRAYSVNGYQNGDLTIDNSVMIYNNMIRTNSVRAVRMYARRLWDLDRSIDVNARAQKTPVLLQGTEQQRLTLLNAYKELDGNSPVIMADKDFDLRNGPISCISTEAPYVADKLYQLKTEIWNEALTYLGISNLNIQKKERLVADEVTRNMGGTIASRYSRLEMRRKAAEEINDMFGTDIEVNYREDYREADDEVMFAGESGDGNLSDMAVDIRTK